MKISVIVPYWEKDEGKKEVLTKCVKSLPDRVDETIIVWNQRMGYAPSINRGCMTASGDYFLIMNDDVEYVSGNIEGLCVKDTVTSPLYNDREYENIWGSCFCVPADVWKLIGGMDERYETSYFDDDDLIFTLKSHKIEMKPVHSVVFDHKEPGRTLNDLPDRDEFFEKNKQRFFTKWGKLP